MFTNIHATKPLLTISCICVFAVNDLLSFLFIYEQMLFESQNYSYIWIKNRISYENIIRKLCANDYFAFQIGFKKFHTKFQSMFTKVFCKFAKITQMYYIQKKKTFASFHICQNGTFFIINNFDIVKMHFSYYKQF